MASVDPASMRALEYTKYEASSQSRTCHAALQRQNQENVWLKRLESTWTTQLVILCSLKKANSQTIEENVVGT